MNIISIRLAALAILAGLLGAQQAWASGFALREFSSIEGGESDAGMAAAADDLSTITTNPAGMTYFEGQNVVLGSSYVDPSGTFSLKGAGTNVAGLPFALPVSGGAGRSPTVGSPVPFGYLEVEPAPDWRLGIGLTVPFGLQTEYDSNSAVRYQALQSKVTSFDINPSVAYKVAPWLSVGAGASFQNESVKLSNAIDFGTLVPLALARQGLINPLQAAYLLATGAGRPYNDGRVDLSGNSWGAGFDVGFIAEPVEGTRIGVSYRSGIDEPIKGQATFRVPNQYYLFALESGEFNTTNAQSTLNLPGNVLIGLTQKITPDITASVSYQWTNWSRFQAIRVTFDNPRQATSVSPENYQDSSYFAAGVAWHVCQPVTVRFGAAYDETPTTDSWRDMRLPDGNRTFVSTGATWQVTDRIAVNGSYEHLFFDAAPVDHTVVVTPGVTTTIIGTASTSAEVLAASVSFAF